jgi:hypothetical protein
MTRPSPSPFFLTAWLFALLATVTPEAGRDEPRARRAHTAQMFKTSDSCVACHNGLTTSAGEDISIGSDWRSSMMANSSRDPYWQGSVRREIADHPLAGENIEDECSICHMPMARAVAKAEQRRSKVFAHLPIGRAADGESRLAADGVSCTMCHQIDQQGLGSPESFTGGFVVATPQSTSPRPLFGPFQIDSGRTTIMRSATRFQPAESAHVRQSELCATCHTLYTQALGPQGQVIGSLPEQMPYLEWRHSSYANDRSCQGCHMPVVEEETRIASVMGELRPGFARHVFRGGNFFMLRMLNRYRDELGVDALSQELNIAADRTIHFLQSEAATLGVERAGVSAGELNFEVSVRNLAGHKLPTGYPSRRVWLHVTVFDSGRRMIFESGGFTPNGMIQGNDSDSDPARFEPHYSEIRRPDEVQIYESVMGDAGGGPTTGLLTAVGFLKDNRLLPKGFEKATAGPDIAVAGPAAQDDDFVGGSDRLRYAIDVAERDGPFEIRIELRYQPIAFRWAQNLKKYEAAESRRFVGYYESMASASSEVLARATLTAQ